MLREIEKGLSFFKLPFSEESVNKLAIFVSEVERWSAHINLTGLRDPSLFVRRLLFDTFFLFRYFTEKKAMDMGSGSGVIAIPFSILKKEAEVFSVDSRLKRIQFQRHIKRLLDLRNLNPIHGRVESIEPLSVDHIFVKAFGSIEDILSKGKRHLKKDGRIYIVKGKREKPKDVEGFILDEITEYELPDMKGSFLLLVYRKTFL